MPRGKKILEQLSRTRLLTVFENPAFFPLLRSRGEKARDSNSVKNRVLERCSNIFFTLEESYVRTDFVIELTLSLMTKDFNLVVWIYQMILTQSRMKIYPVRPIFRDEAHAVRTTATLTWPRPEWRNVFNNFQVNYTEANFQIHYILKRSCGKKYSFSFTLCWWPEDQYVQYTEPIFGSRPFMYNKICLKKFL